MQPDTSNNRAEVEFSDSSEGGLVCRFSGRLDAWSCAALWEKTLHRAEQASPAGLIIDGEQVAYCDSAGATLWVELCRRQQQRGGSCEVRGLQPAIQQLVALCQADRRAAEGEESPRIKLSFSEEIGKATLHILNDLKILIMFIGELCVWLVKTIRTPRLIRWRDVVRTMETAGLNAMPIIGMIGLLLGLILAFQSAIPMSQFGAEIFVANLVAISLLRELGPLITAIILTARSGSAFAAEIGTMKINEEVDALTTMGLDSVRFLVIPRVLGAVAVTPMLALFANLFGLIGAGIVMLSLGFPLVTYVNQVMMSVHLKDLLGGLFKAFVFGILISAVGCQRGLQTGTGASAVGDSTTRSVVSGIVLIVVTDGLFAVAFYYLGI